MKWPTAGDLMRAKLQEANASTIRLKHKVADWLNKGNIWMTRCHRCNDTATVRIKGLSYEIGGPATILECRPTKPLKK